MAASSSRISPPSPKSGPVKQGRERGVSVMDERQIAGAERIWHCKALGVGGLSALRRASQAWERMEGELAEKTLSGVWGWWCLVGLGCWCSSQPALEGRTTVAPSSSIMAPTQFPLPGFAQASQPTSRLPPLCCVHHGRPLCHLPF